MSTISTKTSSRRDLKDSKEKDKEKEKEKEKLKMKEKEKQKRELEKAKKKLAKEALKAELKSKKRKSGSGTESPSSTSSLSPQRSPRQTGVDLVSLPTVTETIRSSLTHSPSQPILLHTSSSPLIPEPVKEVVSPSRPVAKVSLNDFKVLRLIGKGGFGEVYLAEYKATGKKYALKVMEKRLITEMNKVQHILNERDVLVKSKSNPYLVHLHYAFRDEHYLYFAMEYCPGGDLRSLLNAIGTLQEDEARLYFAEMIMAVHSLHQMGYLHRDLKPDNFLIDARGHLKLADFGLSKEGVIAPPSMKQSRLESRKSLLLGEVDMMKLSQENFNDLFTRTRSGSKLDQQAVRPISQPSSPTSPLTRRPPNKEAARRRRMLAYSIVGSPDYMSPEVLNSSGYSQEADWWSLGCNFFEILIGEPPFTGETPDEVFENIANWKVILPQTLSQYAEYMSPQCFDLISGLLKEPSERLGARGIEEIMNHPFFAGLDWDNLLNETPPFIPKLQGDDDTSYFDDNVQDKEPALVRIDTDTNCTSESQPPKLTTAPTIPNLDLDGSAATQHIRAFSFAEPLAAEELKRHFELMQSKSEDDIRTRSKRSGAISDPSLLISPH